MTRSLREVTIAQSLGANNNDIEYLKNRVVTWEKTGADAVGGGESAIVAASAIFSADELTAGVTKILVPAAESTYVYPLDCLFAVPQSFTWLSGTSPNLSLDSGDLNWGWQTFNWAGGGVGGKWVGIESMITSGSFLPWVDYPASASIRGQGLIVRSVPNGATAQAELGIFVTARRFFWDRD